MKRKIIIILFVLSLIGNITLGIHAQNLANKLDDAYRALVEWNEFYETMPKSFTYYEDGSIYARP